MMADAIDSTGFIEYTVDNVPRVTLYDVGNGDGGGIMVVREWSATAAAATATITEVRISNSRSNGSCGSSSGGISTTNNNSWS